MLPGHMRTPAQIIGELLTGHPEAASLQAEASHCRALARCSAAHASEAFDAAQTARLGYEELRHRLDPRRARTVGLAAGLLTLTLVGGRADTARRHRAERGAWPGQVGIARARGSSGVARRFLGCRAGRPGATVGRVPRGWHRGRPTGAAAGRAAWLQSSERPVRHSGQRAHSRPGERRRRAPGPDGVLVAVRGPVALASGPGLSSGRGPDRAGRSRSGDSGYRILAWPGAEPGERARR